MPYQPCLNCGKTFYARPTAIRQGFGKYCSKTCSNLHHNPSLNRRIPEEIEQGIVDAYKSGKSKKEAGQLFGYGRGGADKVLKRYGITARSSGDALKGRVFSAEHKRKISETHSDVSGRNNPMFGKAPSSRPKDYIFVEHLNLRVRSTWEAVVARALFSLNIPHEYETKRLTFSDCSTLVDFYLPIQDIYLEVKGRPSKHFLHVLDCIATEMPTLKWVVIYQAEYTKILQSTDSLLELLR